MIVLPTLFYSGCTKKRGRVVNNVTGEGVTSLVVLENKYDKTVVFEQMTDDAGYYSFEDVSIPGTYKLTVERDGYMSFYIDNIAITNKSSVNEHISLVPWITFGGSEDDYANSIVSLSDGGFAIAGYTESKGAGGRDMWLLRLDELWKYHMG